MALLERWRLAALGLCALCGVSESASASPEPAASADARRQVLERLEIALVGDAAQDPLLFERIRSLFPPETAVLLRDAERIDQRAVLLPQRADTVYLWIRVTERTKARVYLALSEEAGAARYLFRELELEAGLDEVGGETLAEVAHSSAQALWLRERQTPRQALVAALEREAEAPRAAGAPLDSAPALPMVAAESRERPAPAAPRSVAAEPAPLRVGFGLGHSAHASGAEGFLHEPGAFLGFEYRARVSLRVAVRYLVPTEFELLPARVHLSGESGEIRVGWLSGDAARRRVRIEAGLGVLLGRARTTLAVDEPSARASAPQAFERIYTLAAATFEWPLGPAWIAAGADLRLPLRTTSYEVGGPGGASMSPTLSPGGSLELGIGFEPGVR